MFELQLGLAKNLPEKYAKSQNWPEGQVLPPKSGIISRFLIWYLHVFLAPRIFKFWPQKFSQKKLWKIWTTISFNHLGRRWCVKGISIITHDLCRSAIRVTRRLVTHHIKPLILKNLLNFCVFFGLVFYFRFLGKSY